VGGMFFTKNWRTQRKHLCVDVQSIKKLVEKFLVITVGEGRGPLKRDGGRGGKKSLELTERWMGCRGEKRGGGYGKGLQSLVAQRKPC